MPPPDDQVIHTPLDDGPLQVKGGATIVDADGDVRGERAGIPVPVRPFVEQAVLRRDAQEAGLQVARTGHWVIRIMRGHRSAPIGVNGAAPRGRILMAGWTRPSTTSALIALSMRPGTASGASAASQ